MTFQIPSLRPSAVALLTGLVLAACNSGGDDNPSTNPPGGMDPGPGDTLDGISLAGATEGIVGLTTATDPRISAVFDRYTALTAPSGERVHLLARPGVSDALLFRTRGMLNQHLSNVDATAFGADKAAVFNRMAAGDSTLALAVDAADFDETDPDVMAVMALFGDALEVVYAVDMVMEASPAYVLPSPAIDNTLGRTAGFVLRRGLVPAVPAFQTELTAATDAALVDGRFRAPAGLAPDRVDDAYLELALDVYYGIWGHDPRGDGTAGAAGEYDFSTRVQMEMGDPNMVDVIASFFAPNHSYPAFLHDSYAQTFEMAFTPVLPYTHRSRYLERVGLRADGQATRINGNDLDNVFIGNGFENRFEGRGGNDIADMQGGVDILYFTGPSTEYSITETSPGVFRIEDQVLNRDGIDDVRGATQLEFFGATVNL